jgi:flagellar hook protein FlgE
MLNKQHTEGIDLNGKDGLPLFATDGVSINPSQTNRGSARIDLTFDANTTSSGNTYSARYDEKTDLWTVHSKSGVSASGKNNIVLDGIHFNINGKPADGDTFFGQPMANAAASMRFLIKDPSQIASALPLYVEKNTANKGSSTLTISDRHASIPASGLPQAKSLIAPNLSGINSFLRDGAAFVIPAGTSKANLISLGTVSSVHFLTIGNEISNLNRPAPISGQSTFTLSFKLDDQSSQTQLTINPKGSSLTDIANAINDAAEKTTNPKLSKCIHASVSNGVLDITGLNNANPTLPAHTISDAVFDTIPHIPHIPDSIGFPVTGENEASHTPAQLQVFTKEGIQVSGPRLTSEQVSRLINEKNGFSKDAVYSYLGVNNNYPGLIASSSEAPLTINSINSYTKNITFQNNPSFESSKSDASGAMSSGSVYVLNLEDAPSIRLSGDEITGKNSDSITGLLSQKLNSLVTQRSIYGGAMDFSSMSSPTLKFNVTLNGTTSQVTFHRSIDPAGNLMSTGNFEIDGDASIHLGLVPDLSGTNVNSLNPPIHLVVSAYDELGSQDKEFSISAAGSPNSGDLSALGLSGNNAPGFSGNNAIMQLKGSGFLDPKDLSSTKVLKIQFGAASPYTNATITVNPNNKDGDGLPILESSLPAKLTASWSSDGHIVIKSTDQTAHLTTSNTSERSDAAALGFFCTDLSFQNNLEGQSGITISSSLGALNIENLSTSPDGSRFNLNKALDEDLIVMTTSDPSMNSLRSIATELTPDPLQTQFEPQDLSVKIISGTKLEIYSTTKDASGNPIRLATRNWKSLEPVTFGKISFIIQGNPVVDDVFDIVNDPSRTGDNQNALAISNLTDAPLYDKSEGSFKEIYNSVAASMGTHISSAKITADSAKQSMNDLKSAYSAKTGVSLDQEASDLIKFQQAYQASAQIISAARDMFQTLLHTF